MRARPEGTIRRLPQPDGLERGAEPFRGRVPQAVFVHPGLGEHVRLVVELRLPIVVANDVDDRYRPDLGAEAVPGGVPVEPPAGFEDHHVERVDVVRKVRQRLPPRTGDHRPLAAGGE